jgi:hypothetical protein
MLCAAKSAVALALAQQNLVAGDALLPLLARELMVPEPLPRPAERGKSAEHDAWLDVRSQIFDLLDSDKILARNLVIFMVNQELADARPISNIRPYAIAWHQDLTMLVNGDRHPFDRTRTSNACGSALADNRGGAINSMGMAPVLGRAMDCPMHAVLPNLSRLGFLRFVAPAMAPGFRWYEIDKGLKKPATKDEEERFYTLNERLRMWEAREPTLATPRLRENETAVIDLENPSNVCAILAKAGKRLPEDHAYCLRPGWYFVFERDPKILDDRDKRPVSGWKASEYLAVSLPPPGVAGTGAFKLTPGILALAQVADRIDSELAAYEALARDDKGQFTSAIARMSLSAMELGVAQ